MRRYSTAVAAVIFLIPQATKSCDDGDRMPPNMIVNGNTKILASMVGKVYLSKGPTDSAKKKGLRCEWRIIKKDGIGSRFRIANGPMSVKFLKHEVGGVFVSHYCRIWILQFKEN